ncbi:MAG: D-alanine--D-alanine ligase [Armatimonadota bacterium]|nr:D-alanine--D-alanine ligase [Armatimonadota bacterium]
MIKIKVAVLMGGRSSERAVSLSTGKMILDALNPEKYDTFPVDAALFGGDKPQIEACGDREIAALTNAEQALKNLGTVGAITDLFSSNGLVKRPDVVFIALHGKYGEDGTVQGLLELAGIPYTGSGVLASALAMDKIMAKKFLALEGVPVIPAVDINNTNNLNIRDLTLQVTSKLSYPVIVKPSKQGSTIGMSKVESEDELATAVETALKYDDQLLIEKFITGAEITAGVLGNDDLIVLPLVEIVPSGGFYDYEAKYTPGATEEIVPARIPEDIAEEARRLAIVSHRALGCKGMSRVDMILNEREIYVLEVNTIPGMTPTSLLPRAAQAAGISFPDLLDKLISLALEGK